MKCSDSTCLNQNSSQSQHGTYLPVYHDRFWTYLQMLAAHLGTTMSALVQLINDTFVIKIFTNCISFVKRELGTETHRMNSSAIIVDDVLGRRTRPICSPHFAKIYLDPTNKRVALCSKILRVKTHSIFSGLKNISFIICTKNSHPVCKGL